MSAILLILPFLLLSSIGKMTLLQRVSKFCSHIFLLSIFSIIPVFPVYAIFFFFDLLSSLFVQVFDNEPPFLTPRLLLEKWQMKDSIKKEVSLPLIAVCCAFIFPYCFFLEAAPLWFVLFFPAILLIEKKHLPYFLLCIFKYFKKAPISSDVSYPKPENEQSLYLDKDYPLEKYTYKFCGQKTFSLPKKEQKDPHIVFIYLESFRESEVDENTPTLNKLSKEGISFSNFYANATQTFKAMFATMYGLIPCFGSDIEKSSSPVLSLPLFGIADFLEKKGYENIFVKGGNNYFDRQGDFLGNHNFHQCFDEQDIKKSNKKAYGTSWGVHDEFLFSFLEEKLQNAKKPLFISGATITSHHPFILPKNFSSNKKVRPYRASLEYVDKCLGDFIQKLSLLDAPIHLYVMGDHGFPNGHDDKPSFSPSLDPFVTKVPFIIYPIGCGEFKSKRIDTISSQIDILPTMMDLYNLTGKNSSLGSSLCRKKTKQEAFLLNEFMENISGRVTPSCYETSKGYSPLYQNLFNLYKEEQISSSVQNLKTLDVSKQNILTKDLAKVLSSHPGITNLHLNNCTLLTSLDLPFNLNLKKITIENNFFIEDADLAFLPKSLTSISLLGCANLTDEALIILKKLPLKQISLPCNNFSGEALSSFIRCTPLKKVHLTKLSHLEASFYHCFEKKNIEEVFLEGAKNLSNSSIKSICSPNLTHFMSNCCKNLSDEALAHLHSSSLKVLHLENAPNITNTGIEALSHLPLHTFFISKACKICNKAVESLNTKFIQNIFCIDCENLTNYVLETAKKKIYCLKKEGLL